MELNLHVSQRLTEAISCLTHAVVQLTEQRKIEHECSRSRSRPITKEDLLEMEERMAIKLSELKTEVAGIRTQVQKIWTEQQQKYDHLVEEFDKLKASLDNAELPADVEQDLTEFKAELKAFDDSIPDTTA